MNTKYKVFLWLLCEKVMVSCGFGMRERERVEHTLDPKWRDERDSCKYSLQGAILITNDVFAFPIL
jgi:hypothetical protein